MTVDKSNNPTAYIFGDTPNSEVYYSSTQSDLANYATAIVNGTLADKVNLAGLSNGTYYARGFMKDVCQPSTIMTITVQA